MFELKTAEYVSSIYFKALCYKNVTDCSERVKIELPNIMFVFELEFWILSSSLEFKLIFLFHEMLITDDLAYAYGAFGWLS